MSSRSDQYGEETYREEEPEDRGWFPAFPSWGWGGAWGIPPFAARSEEDPRDDEEAYEGAGESTHEEDDSDRVWDEGLTTLLIVGGAILFLFPEPATSGLGIVLLILGVIGWLID